MFDITPHLIPVQGGKAYLPVAPRLIWFREEHPKGSITTEFVVLDLDKRRAVCKATIQDENGTVLATGVKFEDAATFGDYIEKCETSAIGRALNIAGFGTAYGLYAGETNEEERLCEAPVAQQDQQRRQQGNHRDERQQRQPQNQRGASHESRRADQPQQRPEPAFRTQPTGDGVHCTEPGCDVVPGGALAGRTLQMFGRILCARHMATARPLGGDERSVAV